MIIKETTKPAERKFDLIGLTAEQLRLIEFGLYKTAHGSTGHSLYRDVADFVKENRLWSQKHNS